MLGNRSSIKYMIVEWGELFSFEKVRAPDARFQDIYNIGTIPINYQKDILLIQF